MIPSERNRRGYGLRNHGRPWACEREGPVLKKMLWKVGVYSCLSERLIKDGRDSAKRVVSETISPSVPPKLSQNVINNPLTDFASAVAGTALNLNLGGADVGVEGGLDSLADKGAFFI